MKRLNNKTAVVTGGTSGMGYATAEALINEGAHVIITGRNREKLQLALARLGDQASGFVSDAGNMTDLLTLSEEVKRFAPQIDILFVNAGYGKFAPIGMVTEKLYDDLFDVLAKGTFFTVQQLLPLINAGGSVILNTSVVTQTGWENFSVYSAAKSAVQSFIKTFAAECTPLNIRVNGISPGHIATNIFENTGLSAEEIDGAIAGIIPTIPFKRLGESSEIARAVCFLASDDASYIHAAELSVDGGLSGIYH